MIWIGFELLRILDFRLCYQASQPSMFLSRDRMISIACGLVVLCQCHAEQWFVFLYFMYDIMTSEFLSVSLPRFLYYYQSSVQSLFLMRNQIVSEKKKGVDCNTVRTVPIGLSVG